MVTVLGQAYECNVCGRLQVDTVKLDQLHKCNFESSVLMQPKFHKRVP